MVTIQVEVRFANYMEGCPDYFDVSKENAIKKIILDCLVTAAPQVAGIINAPFSIALEKKWNRLPKTGYFFKEDPQASRYSLCFLRKKPIRFATAEVFQIFLIGPEVPGALITYGYT